jgi:hypothetical protein
VQIGKDVPPTRPPPGLKPTCILSFDSECRYPPRLVAGEQMSRRATARLVLEIDAGERLPVGVANDEAPPIQLWVGLFDGLSKVLTGCGVRWRFTQSAEG